ncbi:nucleoside monophosphate kinase, partial [candidate division KSB1 bacterium]|nr:nucleoside monophosphate kinase [candidate division KSB1 bacterium]
MNIVLLGAPGVGKGTYAEILSEKLEIPHISTGDLIRDKSKTDENMKKIIDSGKLISDDQVLDLLKEKLKEKSAKNGIILDGYPRNVQQAEDLKKVVKIDKVIYYVADDK